MLSKIKKFQILYVKKIINSIAFYPTTVTLCLFILAIVLLKNDNSYANNLLEKHLPNFVIYNADTARVLLSTLIGGVISLTVFSFSMVMITLSQASANFSPRLLPGLISEKKNQIVLGFYLGTIIYNISVLISIKPSGETSTLNVFAIITGTLLGVLCLAFFIYFIQNISSSIQINNILYKIYKNTSSFLDDLNPHPDAKQIAKSNHNNWNTILSNKAGYFHGYNESAILEICSKNKVDMIIDVYVGQFVMSNYPIIRISRLLVEEETNALLDKLVIYPQNELNSHYISGIDQITEVGIRSLSPGINDPATALTTLDYLSVILNKRMKNRDYVIYSTENDEYKLQEQRNPFCKILSNCYSVYRIYAKHDVIVMRKLLTILHHLKKQESINPHYYDCIDKQIKTLLVDAKESISNQHDLQDFINQYDQYAKSPT